MSREYSNGSQAASQHEPCSTTGSSAAVSVTPAFLSRFLKLILLISISLETFDSQNDVFYQLSLWLASADDRSMWHVQSSGCYPWDPPKQQSTPNTPSVSPHDVYIPQVPVISDTPFMIGRTDLAVMGMVSPTTNYQTEYLSIMVYSKESTLI